MKIQVIKIGKPTTKQSKELVELYFTRTRVFNAIESIEWKDLDVLERNAKNLIGPGNHLVVLDEQGKQWSSPDFSCQLQSWMDNPAIKCVSFLIGGPYGVDKEWRARANVLWSLSKATLPSDLAWVLTWEQVYRAFTLLKGMPYHHG